MKARRGFKERLLGQTMEKLLRSYIVQITKSDRNILMTNTKREVHISSSLLIPAISAYFSKAKSHVMVKKKEKYSKGKYTQKINSSTRRLALIYSLISSARHALFYKKRLIFMLSWSSLSQTSAFNVHFYLDTQLVPTLQLCHLIAHKTKQEQE